MAEREARPSPEALLDAAKQEGRGRLKIFLGAAPGVGKTYEMLLSAQAKRREGVEIVVGIVETHGRRETEALLGCRSSCGSTSWRTPTRPAAGTRSAISI